MLHGRCRALPVSCQTLLANRPWLCPGPLYSCNAPLSASSRCADEYYTKKSSSTIAMAINVGVPLVAEQR